MKFAGLFMLVIVGGCAPTKYDLEREAFMNDCKTKRAEYECRFLLEAAYSKCQSEKVGSAAFVGGFIGSTFGSAGRGNR